CVLVAIEKRGAAWALASGGLLGVGFYSHVGAWATMPMLLGVSWIAFALTRQSFKMFALATLGFVFLLMPFVAFLQSHPDMLSNAATSYHLYDARRFSLLQGVKEYLNYTNVQEKVDIYWNYFNPSFILLAGGSNLTTATRKVGIFLLPVGVF